MSSNYFQNKLNDDFREASPSDTSKVANKAIAGGSTIKIASEASTEASVAKDCGRSYYNHH